MQSLEKLHFPEFPVIIYAPCTILNTAMASIVNTNVIFSRTSIDNPHALIDMYYEYDIDADDYGMGEAADTEDYYKPYSDEVRQRINEFQKKACCV